MKRKKRINVFSLAFLDCITCGLGAVILLFVIINAKSAARQETVTSDLMAETTRLEEVVQEGRKNLVTLRNTLEETTVQVTTTQGLSRRVIETISPQKIEQADRDKDTLAREAHINKLKTDVLSLDEELRRLRAGAKTEDDQGSSLRPFPGQGDRQYLTDLKMGGKRILILVDASASMLDETIINVIRRRNMDVSHRRGAPKWKRTLATLDWLVGNLPADARFQLYTFNKSARAVLSGSEGKWLKASNSEELEGAIRAMHKTDAVGGTSLFHAFSVAKELSPRPDNILLITDGLPTWGRNKPKGTTVSSAERLAYFEKASRTLPKGVPVNTILMPMEGDAWAAAAYWRLAIDTRGYLLTPARDWP